MSVAKSFFDITTGRSHGVIPTSDAVRVILDSGSALLLDRLPQDGDGSYPNMIRASAVVRAHDDKFKRQLTFDIKHVAVAGRVDKVLSSLVEKMVLGESGVEVTEWTIPEEAAKTADSDSDPFGRVRTFVLFGRHEVSLILIGQHEGTVDDEIARLLMNCVKAMRLDCGDRINAVVVRVPGHAGRVGIACLPEKPNPPIGATLTARHMVVGEPHADAPWNQVVGMGRFGLVRRAIDKAKHSYELAGFDVSNYIPRLSVVLGGGQQIEESTLPTWSPDTEALGHVIESIVARYKHNDADVVSLRVTAVQMS